MRRRTRWSGRSAVTQTQLGAGGASRRSTTSSPPARRPCGWSPWRRRTGSPWPRQITISWPKSTVGGVRELELLPDRVQGGLVPNHQPQRATPPAGDRVLDDGCQLHGRRLLGFRRRLAPFAGSRAQYHCGNQETPGSASYHLLQLLLDQHQGSQHRRGDPLVLLVHEDQRRLVCPRTRRPRRRRRSRGSRGRRCPPCGPRRR